MSSWLQHSYFEPEDTVAQVSARLERLVDALALDYFSFGLVKPPDDGEVDYRIPGFASFPQEWIDRYVRHRYLQLDPVVDLAARSTRPFYWGHGRFLRAFRKQQRVVFEEAREFGIVSGLSIPVRCARGAVGVFSVVASDATRLKEATRCEHERLFAAAYDTHDFAQNHWFAAAKKDPDPGLTVRERECLLWTIEGKTAEDVAAILGVSVFTVNRHASTAARKLGCLNKYHAAFRALRADLI